MQGANAAAVRVGGRGDRTQVAKLLPEGIGKASRNRLVGEIYRELDTALRGNRVLTQQLRCSRREADYSTRITSARIVGLVTARAKQSLPAVAKRVMNEWTRTVVTIMKNDGRGSGMRSGAWTLRERAEQGTTAGAR